MEINYRTLTLFLVTMSAGMSQAYEIPAFNKGALQNKAQINKNILKPYLSAQCKKPSPVVDIWSLEPLLVKKGLIKKLMSKKQKRAVLQAYINNKNAQFKKCIKSNRQVTGTVKGFSRKCEKPVMILDELKLEALLIKRNQIDKSMDKAQRQKVLLTYKNKKMRNIDYAC
ncbi:MAG: hypothetical protein HRT38_11175 [Alteromonadaceae bacterium]|nr:hypothetical protein [Alteromonadaceae bacterium]